MLVDPALRHEIVTRIAAGNYGDEPGRAVHGLGLITLPDGSRVKAYLCHAADAVLLDEHGHIALITRQHNPGRGKLAVPGGLLEDFSGRAEASRDAALREAVEETGIDPARLATAEIFQLGPRRYNRPFDIRRAWSDLPGTPVLQGELFAVSTLGFGVRLKGDLTAMALQAGDDAKEVRVLPVSALRAEEFAVPDHPEMIEEALAG